MLRSRNAHRSLLALLLAMAALAAVTTSPGGSLAREGDAGALVLVGEIRGFIGVFTHEYARAVLQRAGQEGARLVVFVMDTPGGSSEATDDIIQSILASQTPVAVYVSPSGAQAGSAGLYITNAADVAAMAPGTRIGAGHPVFISPTSGSGEEGKAGRDYMSEKAENDAAAGVRSIASGRGRNAEVYERMVRESISLTETEALDQRVIDLVAGDLESLLKALDGRRITRFDGASVTLELADPRIERAEMSLWQTILSWVSHPQVVVILFAVGMLGIYMEFNNPGLIAPGVIGALALVLFLISLQVLPVNILGVLLIVLSVALFVLEIKFTSYGLLTLGGVVSLTMGFLLLFDIEGMPSLRIQLSFILPTSITVGLVMLAVTTVAVRAQRTRVVTGIEGMLGEVGEAVTDIAVEGSAGRVLVHGEYWNARSPSPVARGTRVKVTRVTNMDIEVEPVDI
ncbi:MAG TPA: nodulation protein NfeD [Candidatus Polarisedimenticolia bacterium]|nr:nodulation protein NfeD [Candidatus Polarisedimenticolia bacterium]